MAVKPSKVYTEQQQMYLDALPSVGGKVRAAMDIAGFSKSTPERYIINILHEEMVEIANKLLAASSIQAALGLASVLDSPEDLGNSHKINAANSILDRTGLAKKSESDLKVDTGGGILILPAKRTRVTIESDEG